jgi:GDPmannose 4,6-dehydratase
MVDLIILHHKTLAQRGLAARSSSARTSKAIIVGSAGQDGQLLFQRLERNASTLLGIERGGVRHNLPNGRTFEPEIDILDRAAVERTIKSLLPDEIFYLAAYHHASEDEHSLDDADLYLRSHDIHVRGLLNVLEAVRIYTPRTRVFYAGSSHCFGNPPTDIQDERTPLNPNCAYGITKTAGVQLCRTYRAHHSLHVSCGFLYNHESPLRAPNFLSTKIVRAVADIYRGNRRTLVLGDLTARVDWGYAPDYVEAMTRIVGLDTPDDFVIASGISHSVEEFVTIAFSHLGLDWRQYVETDPSLLTKRKASGVLVGDTTKLAGATGWSPTVTFEEMVRLLVAAEIRRTPG